MAAFDSYSPCPCGSGQKFKWCCQKAEAEADRAHRLFVNGQTETAIQALQDGLRKFPGMPLLLMRQVVYQLQSEQFDAARATVNLLLEKSPKHILGNLFLVRILLVLDSARAACDALQKALSLVTAEFQSEATEVTRLVAMRLGYEHSYLASLRHYELAESLATDADARRVSTELASMRSRASIPLWLKNPNRLSPAPESLPGAARARFQQALDWAEQGLWNAAAATFEVLSADGIAPTESDRNLALCRLWTADSNDAVEPLARAVKALGTSTDAVDLEVLRQGFYPHSKDDMVERVQLTWPLRSRDRLIQTLESDASIVPGRLDEDDESEDEKIDHFLILDRPRPAGASGLKTDDIPRIQGTLLVAQAAVTLDALDDAALDPLTDRFTTLVGDAVPRAHPKTKVVGAIPRSTLAVSFHWLPPEDLSDEDAERLEREQFSWQIREVWANTPLPYLNNRSVTQAAKAGDAVVPVRAAIFMLEMASKDRTGGKPVADLRQALGIAPEPEIDPDTVDIEGLNITRLRYVPLERLDDSRLVAVYRRAKMFGLVEIMSQAGTLLAARPTALGAETITLSAICGDLARLSARNGDRTVALEWVKRGRDSTASTERSAMPAAWDMIELEVRALTEPPEAWVPELAVILDRYQGDEVASQGLVMGLYTLGLVQFVPHPERPNQVLVDTRMLRGLLDRFGPRVTTAGGQLGISATRGELWTPGGPAKETGAIWTPGSGSGTTPPGGENKPRLIIPGR